MDNEKKKFSYWDFAGPVQKGENNSDNKNKKKINL